MSRSSPLRRSRIEEALEHPRFARHLELLGIVSSTSDLLLRRGREGAADGSVLIAEDQYAGRGRRGARWTSKVRRGLCFSFLLRPPPAPPTLCTPAIALGLADALREFGADARIKWPNDLLLGQSKLGGALVDVTTDAKGHSFAVCGVGLNIDVAAHEISTEGALPATSFTAAGLARPNREALLARCLDAVAQRLDHLATGETQSLREAYADRDALTGHFARIEGPDGMTEGRVERVDPALGITLQPKDGPSLTIAAEHAHVAAIEWLDR